MGKEEEEAIEVEGRVKQALPNTTFRVELDINGTHRREDAQALHPD